MWSPETLGILIFTFVVAGLVKGVTGMGLPTVALAILAAIFDLAEAMVLMLVPSLVTNIWQAFAGNALIDILRRQWLLLVTGSLVTIILGIFSTSVDTAYLLILLGAVLCLYSVFSLLTPQLNLSATGTGWLPAAMGAIAGTITGLTGTFVVPAVPYFQALGLRPHVLIQTMGVWFTLATLSLGVGLNTNGNLTGEFIQLSTFAIAPALAGMWIGQRVRNKLPEQKFRTIFFLTLFVLGLYIAFKAILS